MVALALSWRQLPLLSRLETVLTTATCPRYERIPHIEGFTNFAVSVKQARGGAGHFDPDPCRAKYTSAARRRRCRLRRRHSPPPSPIVWDCSTPHLRKRRRRVPTSACSSPLCATAWTMLNCRARSMQCVCIYFSSALPSPWSRPGSEVLASPTAQTAGAGAGATERSSASSTGAEIRVLGIASRLYVVAMSTPAS